jgi:ABC-type nitrate/sulfonate/bicarbonate transport system substrate-binding protein
VDRNQFKLGVVITLSVCAVAIAFRALWLFTQPRTYDVTVARALFTANLPYFVAKSQGFFEKQHLRVEDLRCRDGAEMLNHVINGKADVAAPVPLIEILNVHVRDPDSLRVVLFAVESASSHVSAIVVPTKSEVQTIRGLAGKKIAPYNNSESARASLKMILKGVQREAMADGTTFDPDSVTITKSRADTVLQEIASGKIDAAFLIEPQFSLAVVQGYGRVIEFNPRARYINDPYIVGALAIPKAFVRDNRDAARAFSKSIVDATKWIKLHPVEARNLLAEVTGVVDPKQLEHSGTYVWELPDDKNEIALEKVVNVMVDQGLLSGQPDLKTLLGDRSLCR